VKIGNSFYHKIPVSNFSAIKSRLLLASDKFSKASTYIHHWYGVKASAPPIMERQPLHTKLPARVAPSKSPDLLVIFSDAPTRPLFTDFVFSSPRLSDKTVHSQAAQAAFSKKRADYSKYHTYPDNTFFPLAAERSGYLHPTFTDFIDTFLCFASFTPVAPSVKLQIMYSIAFAITRMSASLLKAASFCLIPASVSSLCPPPPLIPPLRWAPGLILHEPRHRSFGVSHHSNIHLRRRAAVNPPLHNLVTKNISHGTDVVTEHVGEAPSV
jgi:hypothetical protein